MSETTLETAMRILVAAEAMLRGGASEEDEGLVADFVFDLNQGIQFPVPILMTEIASRVFNRDGSETDKVAVAAYIAGKMPGFMADLNAS